MSYLLPNPRYPHPNPRASIVNLRGKEVQGLNKDLEVWILSDVIYWSLNTMSGVLVKVSGRVLDNRRESWKWKWHGFTGS